MQKLYTISIYTSEKGREGIALLLDEIASQIRKGNNFGDGWALEGDGSDEDDDA